MTVTSSWLPFVTGASLHILSDHETKDIETLLHFIDEKRINFLNVTPSHFSMLVNTLGFLDKPVTLSPRMTVMLGAEIINVSDRSEEHTSELQSRQYLVCRLLLEKKITTMSKYQ